jgi:hypothetical protein
LIFASETHFVCSPINGWFPKTITVADLSFFQLLYKHCRSRRSDDMNLEMMTAYLASLTVKRRPSTIGQETNAWSTSDLPPLGSAAWFAVTYFAEMPGGCRQDQDMCGASSQGRSQTFERIIRCDGVTRRLRPTSKPFISTVLYCAVRFTTS